MVELLDSYLLAATHWLRESPHPETFENPVLVDRQQPSDEPWLLVELLGEIHSRFGGMPSSAAGPTASTKVSGP